MPSKNSLTDRMKAFNTGTMNVSKKALSKRELEEQRKKEEEKETAKVFEDFVASFDEKTETPKASFVRGSIINADSSGVRELKNDKEGTLYQPQPKKSRPSHNSSTPARSNLEEIKREIEKRMLSERARKARKDDTRKKSNLEAFKEELKQMHEAREEHVKIKQQIETIEEKVRSKSGSLTSHEQKILSLKNQIAATEEMANVDVADPNSTNLYCSNIHTDLLEEHLCKLFGRYGPLASVKIMYPRSDDEKSISSRRNTNCGFVAFMCRKDAEKALRSLNGIEYKGTTMSVTWGRVVPIPPHPIYIPARLRKRLMPPPPTRQPFNCLHPDMDSMASLDENEDDDAKKLWEKNLEEACVKVCIPTDRALLNLIHRMVEFVVREGPMFEALIMNRELNNPMFRFLFDNASPAHLYYRWKLFSVLQGDEVSDWRTETFRMFKNGPIWKPPPKNVYLSGMESDVDSDDFDEDDSGMLNSGFFVKPKHRRNMSPESSRPSRYDNRNRPDLSGQRSPKRGFLSAVNKSRLDEIMKDLTCSRNQIEIAMVFCLNHADCAEQIVRIMVAKMEHTKQHSKRLAFLYLVNDLLHNSSAKVANAASYRRYIEPNLGKIFQKLNESYSCLDGKFKQEQFKNKVMNCFRAWENWTVYPEFMLIKLQNVFLGLEKFVGSDDDVEDSDDNGSPDPDGARATGNGLRQDEEEVELDLDELKEKENLDGIPLSKDDDEMSSEPPDVDDQNDNDDGDDIDGEELQDEDDDSIKFGKALEVPSKWQQIDPSDDVDDNPGPTFATLSKWEKVDSDNEDSNQSSNFKPLDSGNPNSASNDDIDGAPFDDGKAEDRLESSTSLKSDVVSSRNSHVDNESKEQSTTTSASKILDELNLSEAEKRSILREIEVKVMKYQDELESGKKSKTSGKTIQQMLEQYRISLAKKEKSTKSSSKNYDNISSGDEISSSSKLDQKKKKKRHRSPSRSSHSSIDERNDSSRKSSSKKSKRSKKHQKKASKSRSRSPALKSGKTSKSNSIDKSPDVHSSHKSSSKSSKSSRH
ncbi:U2 snRNP-associated SURP motif-containing protein-like [Convolutriloba macropyga]|uniref:U2 snRNP-associated SURP motif-containing protein-like n=1 Tax=Convolutriloba macropyga TaxID=536237 RepID=UPI003F521763